MANDRLPPSNYLSDIFENQLSSEHGNAQVIRSCNSLSEIPANANGVYRLPSGELLSYVNGVSVGARNVILSSTNTAAQNTALIQSALNVGGDVYLSGTEEVLFNNTLVIKSNTRLVLNKSLTLKLANGSDCNMLRNLNWQSPKYNISNLVVANVGVNQGHTASFTFDTPLPHLFNVGDYVIFKGDTTETINGIHLIRDVPNSTRAIINIPTWVADGTQGATPTNPTPSGTITVQLADGNIIIEGGYWNYNTPGQPNANDAYFQHGFNLNKVGLLTFRDVRISGAAYSICITNAFDVNAYNIICDSTRDGFHMQGPCRRILIDGITGQTYDDMVVYIADGTGAAPSVPIYQPNHNVGPSTVSYLPTADADGELIGLTIRNMKPQHQQLRILICPRQGFECSGILIDGYYAQNKGATSPIVWLAPENAETNNTIEDITLKNVRFPGNVNTSLVWSACRAGGKMKIRKLIVENVSVAKGRYFGIGSYVVKIGLGVSVDQLIVRDCDIPTYGPSGGFPGVVQLLGEGAANDGIGSVLLENIKAYGLAADTTGAHYFIASDTSIVIKSAILRNCTFGNRLEVTPTWSAFQTPVELHGCILDGAKAFFSGDVVMSLKLYNCKVVSATQGIINAFGTAANRYNFWIKNLTVGGGHTNAIINMTAGSVNLKSGDESVVLDITKLNRQFSVNAMCVHNGAAAAGTIVTGNLCINDSSNAVGSWHQVSNSALVY